MIKHFCDLCDEPADTTNFILPLYHTISICGGRQNIPLMQGEKIQPAKVNLCAKCQTKIANIQLSLFKNDCNNCQHLNITEKAQHEQKQLSGKFIDHYCSFYNSKVYHRTSTQQQHSPYLYPVENCNAFLPND